MPERSKAGVPRVEGDHVDRTLVASAADGRAGVAPALAGLRGDRAPFPTAGDRGPFADWGLVRQATLPQPFAA